jgi:HAD superfamily hydrolase (TIGR01509 family)
VRTDLARAVFFDLDETLIEHTIGGPELVRRIHATHAEAIGGAPMAEFGAVLREKDGELWGTMFAPVDPGTDPLVRSFRRTLEALGRDPSAAQAMRDTFVNIVLAETRPSPGAKETLAHLRSTGVRTGIITNGYIAFQQMKIDHHGFNGLTDFILVSEAAGAHKPDPRIFRTALEKAKIGAAEAFHVGDHLVNDIGGAQNAGLTGVLYDPRGDRLPGEDARLADGAEHPHHTIQRLDQVPGLVRSSVQA